MRKRYKKKKRSCALCKPHKMGGDNRWTPKDEAALAEFEQGGQEEGSTPAPKRKKK
jgi:hypothetical protein